MYDRILHYWYKQICVDTCASNVLILGLQDEDAHNRQQAAEMLGWLRNERATDALRDDELEVRK